VPRRFLASILSVVLALGVVPAVQVVAAPGCDPFQTPPEIDPSVPTAQSVLGFALGSQEVSAAQANQYMAALDAASDRVVTGQAATSVGGRAIDYAIVGDPSRVTPAGLAAVQAAVATLHDPLATQAQVNAAVASAPVILWLSGNVHGNEESGADASLDALYNLAARGDCVVDNILANAIVVVLPIQNPDGREAATRRNLNGFDMNRDWFARTQPETDGKLEVLRQYPPMLYVDAHEFGLSNYFFPPNADPEYHEIPDQAHDWINNLYSPAITAEFNREGIKFFHGAPYDFFAIVFGDTVPTLGFNAAGMTFEKESDDPIAAREHEHFTSMWASVAAGAAARTQVLGGWHASWAQAYQEGVAGQLEPNANFEPHHPLLQPVPNQIVRGYFFPNDPSRQFELAMLVRRLQRMDVEVRQLTAPLTLTDFHPYGDAAHGATLPAGTYWVSMAQAQKHWVQAMLHEENWIPYDVTYDVTAWSNPLLMNLQGGWSGDIVSPSSSLVAPVATPTWSVPANLPSIGVFEIPNSTRGFESAGQTRYLFRDVWGMPFHDVTVDDILAGLPSTDVLVIPDGFTNYGLQALGAKGKKALAAWVNGGGRLVAWQGGALLASKAGISTAQFSTSNTNAPGTLIRVSMAGSSPLATGIGGRDWVMYQDDRIMKPGLGTAVSTYPAAGTADYATSGLALGVGVLAGSAAVADEAVGSGRVISFASDPNFRAWTQGTQRLLWNALVTPSPAGLHGLAAGSRDRAAAEKAAQDAAAATIDFGLAMRVRVKAADAAATAKVLNRHGAEVARFDVGGDVLFLVANRKDLSAEEDPLFNLIVRDLDKAGIDPITVNVP
jgi:hypothetical protein